MDILAPSSCALIVTTNDPIHITMKTVVKTWEVCLAGALVVRIKARDRQMKSGPLKIEIFSFCFSFDSKDEYIFE